MPKLKRILLSLPLVLGVSVLIGTPVFAQHGADDTTTPSTSASTTSTTGDSTETEVHGGSSSTSSRGGTNTPKSTDDSAEVEVHKGADDTATTAKKVDDSKNSARSGASKLVAELRQEHKSTKTEAERKNVCETLKDGATTRVQSISANANRYQTKIDDILAKAQAFQASKNLTVTDYTSLVASAQAAQTASANSITALQALVPTIDCTKTDNADNVAAFKIAAQDTHDKLKTYRDAVRAVLVALKTAAKAANGSTN